LDISNIKLNIRFSSIVATAIYFTMALISYGEINIISSLILSIAFFIFWNFIIGQDYHIFSIYNLFFGLNLLWGTFARYILLGLGVSNIANDAYVHVADVTESHIITSAYILLSICFLALGKLFCKKNIVKSQKECTSNIKISYYNSLKILRLLQWVAFIIIIVVDIYKINNIRLAVEFEYGTYDTFVNFLFDLCSFVAYLSLLEFFLVKKLKSLILSLLILLPNVILSILSAWKGPPIFFIFTLLIIYSWCSSIKMRTQLKYCAIIILVISIIFPVISIYRNDLTLKQSRNNFDIEAIEEFYSKNSLSKYLTDRFSNYDYDYYVLNLPDATVADYNEVVGLEHERLLSGLIPRVLYPDKKIVSVGLQITHYIYRVPETIYNNLSLSYIGAIWLSYGALGVAILSMVLGYGFCRLESMKEKSFFDFGKYIVYGFCLFNVATAGVAADLLGFIGAYVIINISLFFCKKLVKNGDKCKIM